MNNKVKYNTYAKNIYCPNNQITGMINPPINNYGASTQNESPFILTGGEASGSVWINPSYNVAKESPGISWVL